MADLTKHSDGEQPVATKSITVTPDMISGNYEFKVDIDKSVPKLKANEYQCAACGEIYEYGWSDDEAQAEYEENFPTFAKRNEPVDVVCDDCYLQLTAWKSPKEAEAEGNDLPTTNLDTNKRQAKAQS